METNAVEISRVITSSEPEGRLRRLLRRLDAIFALTVLLPTVLASLYYGLIASDVYISESRFVVKNPQRQAQSTIGALLQNTGFTRAQDDTYSVHDYVLSRDALLDRIDGRQASPFDRSIDVHISHLRRKLGGDSSRIRTIRGVGYQFAVPAPASVSVSGEQE